MFLGTPHFERGKQNRELRKENQTLLNVQSATDGLIIFCDKANLATSLDLSHHFYGVIFLQSSGSIECLENHVNHPINHLNQSVFANHSNVYQLLRICLHKCQVEYNVFSFAGKPTLY